jgi:hypothetical protein
MAQPDRAESAAEFQPQPASNPAVAQRAVPHAAILAAIASIEAAVLFAIFRYAGPSVLFLGAWHVVVLAVAIGVTAKARTRGEDVTFLMLGILGGAVMGPIGYLGASALACICTGPDTSSPLVAQWYERIARSTSVPPDERLCEDVDVGRTLDPDAPPPRSFPAIMRFGALGDRQAILGHIARRFDLAYLPTLKIALASSEPVVRVQAAAVAAHVGPPMRRLLRDRVEAASRAPGDAHEALALLDDLSSLLDSGLLDATERRQAEALVRRLGDTVIGSLSRKPFVVDPTSDSALAARLNARLEQLLIERRRFADLRVQRTAVQLRGRHPTARLRKLTVAARANEPVS